MKIFVLLSLAFAVAFAAPQNPIDEATDWYLRGRGNNWNKRLTIDQFDKEFGIKVADQDEKAKEAERLKQVEDQMVEQNDKFAKGESSFGERLYPFSDLTKEEFDSEMLGAREWDPSRGDAPPEREMGLIEPPMSMRNTPTNQAKLDALYASNRQSAPSAYFSNSKGMSTFITRNNTCRGAIK